jgi:hypothetical protein
VPGLFYIWSVVRTVSIAIDVGTSRDNVDLVLNLTAVSAMQQEGARVQALAPQLWSLPDHDPARTASWSSLAGMHDYFVAKFIAMPGMGSGRMGAMTLGIYARLLKFSSTGRRFD